VAKVTLRNSTWQVTLRSSAMVFQPSLTVLPLRSVAESDQYNSEVVFHGFGYTIYDPQLCRSVHVVGADFDLSTRRSTRHQLSSASGTGGHVTSTTGNTTDTNSSIGSRLCAVIGCEWADAVMVEAAGGGNKLVYASQPAQRRVIVIDVKDSLSPVEVGRVSYHSFKFHYLDLLWTSCARQVGRGTISGVYTIQQTSSKFSAHFQQTSSISTCILNTFAGSLLNVCWIV